MDYSWPLSRKLLNEIIADRITDRFVSNLIWERLDYRKKYDNEDILYAGKCTPIYWSEKFMHAPEIIVKRSASVHLTRSIPKEYKQALKKYLNFGGYRIGELYPRRTRRATAVNWLISWQYMRGEELPDNGPLPSLCKVPIDPTRGHLGDPEIE